MSSFGEDEPVRSLQLYGTDPTVVGKAVRRLVEEIGVDHVDLNFGCPASKVTKKGGGGALPIHRVLFRDIVREAVRAAGDVPVTVKTRVGIDDGHVSFLDAGKAAEDEGCAAIALHARTAYQHYAGEADWPAIAALVEHVPEIPVLGNGDIWEGSDAVAMLARTGCAGVVVGRGCLGRPWLFRDLAAILDGRPVPAPPNLGESLSLLRRHAELLVEWNGRDDLRELRRQGAWYVKGFPVGPGLRRELTAVTTLADLDEVSARALDTLGGDLRLTTEGMRAPRGHTSGPHHVALPEGWDAMADDPTPPVGADVLVSGG
jgi:nifR3 family TIM-barrel protein